MRWVVGVALSVSMLACSDDGDDGDGGADPGGASSGGDASGGMDAGGASSGGADTGGTDSGGADSGGESGGGESAGGADSGGTDTLEGITGAVSCQYDAAKTCWTWATKPADFDDECSGAGGVELASCPTTDAIGGCLKPYGNDYDEIRYPGGNPLTGGDTDTYRTWCTMSAMATFVEP